MTQSGSARLKQGLKIVLRPCFRTLQKVVARLMNPMIAPLEQEIRELRRVVGLAFRQHPSLLEPSRCFRPFTLAELTPDARRLARERLGISPGQIVFVCLGNVRLERGVGECLNALEQIRYWGADAQLYFIGPIEPGISGSIRDAVAQLDIAGKVIFREDALNESAYRDFLVAADGGIQLSDHTGGTMSGPLADCLSAGLPTVCDASLAGMMSAPSFLTSVPDHLSPLLLAERLWEISEAARSHADDATFRARNVMEHNQTNYSPQILKLLLAS